MRREAALAMLRPAWALRKRLIAFAIAMLAAVLQGCGDRILTSGLDLDDEFDRVFERGGGCPSTSLLKQFPILDRKYCAAEEFVKAVAKNRHDGRSAKSVSPLERRYVQRACEGALALRGRAGGNGDHLRHAQNTRMGRVRASTAARRALHLGDRGACRER